LFKEKGMRTFADWLRYYNNLDVAPSLEALEKMRNFYTEKGINILKDAVSIPGVSLHYLLRGAVERGTELYSPGKEAYEMLKEAVVAISGERLKDIVRPELKQEFKAEKNQWLAWDKWSSRTPGLFKLEFEGSRMIVLCSKCYYVDEGEGEKKKFIMKGMLKKQNELMWQRFKEALEGSKDMATNRGFRMRDGQMVTYEQQKLGLGEYYDKQWVLPYGIHT